MPRVARSIVPGCPYHLINRGNGRTTLFHKPADYDAFCRILVEGLGRYAVELYAYCLMPNHWHLLLAERDAEGCAGQLSAFMAWVGVTHVRRHHEHRHTRGGGHVYQGRFKSFPIGNGPYFRGVAHYVESNALRAGLCKPLGGRAEVWPWGSAASPPAVPVKRWPRRRPDDWLEQLNAPASPASLDAIRRSVKKGTPLGPVEWVARTAAEQGLGHTLRAAGRPKKKAAVVPAGKNQ